jgi:hypothetical protein
MKSEEGSWIDHHNKGLAATRKKTVKTQEIRLDPELPIRLSSKNRSSRKMNVSVSSIPRDANDHRYENQLSCFYDGVVSLLSNAGTIWIFGPGETKIELKKFQEEI